MSIENYIIKICCYILSLFGFKIAEDQEKLNLHLQDKYGDL